MDKVKEGLSSLMHDIWAVWMKSVLDRGTDVGAGVVMLEKELVEKWRRQIRTPYKKLKKFEKDKDRTVADKIKTFIGENDASI